MESSDAVAALSALAQDTRLALYRTLVEAGPDGMPAGQLAERLRVPATTLSFHLAQLSHAGLVQAKREGRSIIYAADFAAMTTLVRFLTDQCCQGRPDLCAPNTKPAKVRGGRRSSNARASR